MDAADDMALVCSLAGLTAEETRAMERGGWTVTRLATLEGCEKEILEAVIWRVQQQLDTFDLEMGKLRDLVNRSSIRAKTRHAWDAKRGSQDLLDAHVAHQREVRRKVFGDLVSEDVKSRVELVGSAKRARWPTRLSMKLHIASSDLALRELAEKQERDRWIRDIRDIVKSAKLPVSLRSSQEAMLIRVAKGRRPNTLRKHVKTWAKAARWLNATFNCIWPESPEQFAEFLEAMVEEPCSRSFPESVFKTLMFLEHAGEVPEHEQVCRSQAVKNALEESILRLQGVEIKAARKALLLPVALVVALETYVCDEKIANYDRVYAWFRLFKLWTGMRFDDTKGTPNRTIEMTEWGLKGIISRSKTSGPGKKIVTLPFYIHKDAWICEASWLTVGWKLWASMGVESGMQARDFMLPWPNNNRTGFIKKVVDYPIASAMSQALFNEMTVGKGNDRRTVLEPGLGVLWTEHSERATIRTWAQAARIPEDVRKMLGRWQPSADEGYERNLRTNVLRCQKVLAAFIKQNMSCSDPFDETTVVQLVEQRVQGMGYGQEECDQQMMRLMSFMPGEGAAKPCRRPTWTTSGPVVLVEDAEDVVEVEVEPEAMGGLEDNDEEVHAAPAEITPLESVKGMYVVSVVGRSKTRTLHRIGECHRQPGVHYALFEVLGEDTPSTGKYHKACKQCFGRKDAVAMNSVEEETSGEVSSSEMTDSDREGSE